MGLALFIANGFYIVSLEVEHIGGVIFSHANIDLAYGSLATYVTRHALAVEGPLREYYLVGPQDTSDASAWRTEIGWPIFQTG